MQRNDRHVSFGVIAILIYKEGICYAIGNIEWSDSSWIEDRKIYVINGKFANELLLLYKDMVPFYFIWTEKGLKNSKIWYFCYTIYIIIQFEFLFFPMKQKLMQR